jgi:hypothetical protein
MDSDGTCILNTLFSKMQEMAQLGTMGRVLLEKGATGKGCRRRYRRIGTTVGARKGGGSCSQACGLTAGHYAHTQCRA